VPEHPGGPGEKFMFTYSIRMSVPEACMLGGVYYSSCQLSSRHWTIRSCDRVVSDVSGGGVIGQVCRGWKTELLFFLLLAAVTFERCLVDVPNQHVLCSTLYCYLVRMSLSTRVARHCPKYLDLWRVLFRLCLASMF
jgi:hypothetical protein